MYSLKPVTSGLFESVWAPQYETSLNVKGEGKERGARALLKKNASAEQVPTLAQKDAMFDMILANPGPSFKRVAFA